MKTVFVSPTGDDRNDGSKSSPFKTVQHAIDAVGRGLNDATVMLAAGTYAEGLTAGPGGGEIVLKPAATFQENE
jgi:hypothetical protein